MIDSKLIAKNTVFLYLRLIIILLVTLYTSRVIINKLGIDDYGLYNVLFSTIGLLSFLNGTLSAGTSRFITYALGTGDKQKLHYTFSTALVTHLLLAGFVIFLSETIGLWYMHNVIVIQPERFNAALAVYQISVIATVVSIVQVPFTSEIIAHERMEVYAYVGIYEAIGKLLIVYLLTRSSYDKLIIYAILVASVGFSVTAFYIFYTKRKFEEVRFQISFNKSTFVSILKFSGWNIIANLSNTIVLHGVIMLFNLFFLPVVVASQAIATQISRAMMQFVDSVRVAVNPQVIKLYADQNYEASKQLTLESAGYIFDLLLLLGLPCILIMPALLDVWLVDVPEYAVIFAQFVVFQNIIENFNAAFYIPMVAANKVKKNSLSAIFLCVGQFILLYFMFKVGMGAIWARYISLIVSFIYAFVVKPYILRNDLNYTYKELYLCIWSSIKVLMVAGGLTICIYYLLPQTSFLISILAAMLDVIVVLFASYIFMEKSLRKRLIDLLLRKLKLIYS